MSNQKVFLPIIDNGSGSVKANWAMCMMTSFNGREIVLDRVSDSHADRHCNKAASLFLESDCTDMLIIDTDVLFNAKDIDRILSHDVDLVCGIYPKKSDATEPCLGTLPTLDETRPDGLVQVRWAGRGFMRVRRAVFEAMKEEHGGMAQRFHNYGANDYWSFFASGCIEGDMTFMEPGKREWVSEDILFCLRAAKLGFPVFVDPQVALGHEGSKVYRFGPEQVTRMDSNISSWREIHGWFDFEDLYRGLVNSIPGNGKFVEVGCWLGRSTAAFGEFAKEAGKRIDIHAVDTFCGTPSDSQHDAILRAHGGNIEAHFRANMEACGLNGELTVHAKPSIEAAKEFEDESIDAVFIDADHRKEYVIADIEAWEPKVKRGGILAGHDYNEEGVKAAVDELLSNVEAVGRCWYYAKP